MKTVRAFLAVLLMASSASAQKIAGHSKSTYTLVLEVQSYTAVGDGSYITTGILTTPKGKFRCTLSDQKHYLIAGPHAARKMGHDRLRVIVPIKKHKIERWTFKIISEEEVGNLVHDPLDYLQIRTCGVRTRKTRKLLQTTFREG